VNEADDFKRALKRLHAEKDKAYGGAWKRRGELVSILPNIARKTDRLETLVKTGATIRGEGLLDTVIDFYVYAEKYRLFLAESLDVGELLPPDATKPYSDHDANFDTLAERLSFATPTASLKELVDAAVEHFNICWRQAEARANISHRFALAGHLAEIAGRLVAKVAADDPAARAHFVRSEITDAG
jgi:hypothetical protein